MKLSIVDLAGGEAVLSGAQAGRQLLGKLVSAARPSAEPEPVYLEDHDVPLATSAPAPARRKLRRRAVAF